MTADELLYAAAKRDVATTVKGERTRARILETALELCRGGYEQTTMRAIAAQAGVSLGSAYYYFASKEHLIQAFYARTHDEHLPVCLPLLEGETSLARRIEIVLRTKIETSMPYHRFAGALFKTAADPASPLNPFSDESASLRDESIRLFAWVVDGSKTRPGKAIASHLPRLLWTLQMGVILFWIHDRSEGCQRTFRLVRASSRLVAQMVRLAGLPPLRPAVRSALALLDDLATEDPPAPAR